MHSASFSINAAANSVARVLPAAAVAAVADEFKSALVVSAADPQQGGTTEFERECPMTAT